MRIIGDSGPGPGLTTASLTRSICVTIVVCWRPLPCPSVENRIQATHSQNSRRVIHMCPASARASQSHWLQAHAQAFLSRLPVEVALHRDPEIELIKYVALFFFCLSVLFFCFPNILQSTHSPVFSENKNQRLLIPKKRLCQTEVAPARSPHPAVGLRSRPGFP